MGTKTTRYQKLNDPKIVQASNRGLQEQIRRLETYTNEQLDESDSDSGSGGGGGGSGTVTQTLLLSDDQEFTETGSSFVTKKQFRVVNDSGALFSSYKVVVSMKIVGGGGDTVEVKVDIGGDSVTLTSTSTSEEVKKGTITVAAASDTLLTGIVQLKVTGAGGDTAHVQYTDIYGVP